MMTTTMSFSGCFKMATLLCLAAAFLHRVSADSNAEEIAECDGKIRNAFKLFTQMCSTNAKMKPYVIDGKGMCSKCRLWGLDTLATYAKTESGITEEKGKKSFWHDVPAQMRVGVDCDICIDPDPSKALDDMLKLLEDQNMGLVCKSNDGSGVEGPEVTLDSPKVSDVIDVKAVVQLKQCLPISAADLAKAGTKLAGAAGGAGASIPGMGRRSALPEKSVVCGRMVGNWTLAQILIGLKAYEDNDKLDTYKSKLESRDGKDIQVACKADEGQEGFMKPCTCLCDAGALKMVVMKLVTLSFPCATKQATKEHKQLFSMVNCKDVWA